MKTYVPRVGDLIEFIADGLENENEKHPTGVIFCIDDIDDETFQYNEKFKCLLGIMWVVPNLKVLEAQQNETSRWYWPLVCGDLRIVAAAGE